MLRVTFKVRRIDRHDMVSVEERGETVGCFAVDAGYGAEVARILEGHERLVAAAKEALAVMLSPRGVAALELREAIEFFDGPTATVIDLGAALERAERKAGQ